MAANDIYEWPEHNWYADLLNQLLYDCWDRNFYNDFSGKECMEKSARLREIMLPSVKSLLREMYRTTLNHYLERDKNLLKNSICQSMGEGDIWTYLLISLDSETHAEKVDRLIDLLAENFKLGDYFLRNSALESISNIVGVNMTLEKIQQEMLSYQDCLELYNKIFTEEAKAAIILLRKYYLENEKLFSLPRFMLKTIKNYINEESDLALLRKDVTESSDYLSKGSHLEVGEILMYFKGHGYLRGFQHPPPSAAKYASCKVWYSINKDKSCQELLELQSNINNDFSTVLKVMKHTIRPFSYKVRELKRKEELAAVGRKLFYPKLGMNNTSFLTHYNPTVLHCHYGHKRNTNHYLFCDNVLTTYTKKGIGYSINAANFYEIYKKTPLMDAFCKELVETENKECEEKNGKTFYKPEVNGPSYALRLILHSPIRSEGYWDQQSISIHHAKSVAFMSGNAIIPTPGVHTKVVVTPRVTVTDNALSQADISKKNCLSEKYDPNPLTMFDHYSRENCLFECEVKYAERSGDCVPWTFPKLSHNNTLCTYNDVGWFMYVLDSTSQVTSIKSRQKDCSHCIDECERVDYEYAIQTTPFQDICNVDGAEGDAIEESSNVKGIERYLDTNDEDYNDKLHFKEICLTYAHESISTVDIYVGPPKAVHITRSPRVTFLQQVANLGM